MKWKKLPRLNISAINSIFLSLFCFGKITLFSQTPYHAVLQLNDRLSLPFDINYSYSSTPNLEIHNGLESIPMRFLTEKKDTLYFEFPEIAGQIIFHKNQQQGYWLNLNKTLPLKIPFQFYAVENDQHDVRLDAILDSPFQNYSGTYDVVFTDAEGSSQAVGIFQQTHQTVRGTFRTTTGDYRYLSGGIVNGQLQLSCFDGVHAFLFEARKGKSDSLLGNFYSGPNYRATWCGVLNPQATLPSPYSISYPLTTNALLSISVKNLNGKHRTLTETYFRGTPVVVQIMGTWCPNCLDETRYFMGLNKKEAFKKVRFVMVGFENGANDSDRLKRLKKYVRKIGLNYAVFLGGKASTQQAGLIFHALNGVFSFPTTLFLNRKGEIVKVHSGFDGPGTGEYFAQLQQETEELLYKLLQE